MKKTATRMYLSVYIFIIHLDYVFLLKLALSLLQVFFNSFDHLFLEIDLSLSIILLVLKRVKFLA